jgi:putative transposase
MANTYTQFYVHLVFSPQNRDALIRKEWSDELEKYITGITQNNFSGRPCTGSLYIADPHR